MIADGEQDLAVVFRKREMNRSAARGEVDGVFQQIGDGGAQDECVAMDGQWRGWKLRVQQDTRDFRKRPGLVDGAADNVADVAVIRIIAQLNPDLTRE